MKKSDWFLIAVGVLAFVTGALTYPHLPAMVASHWNAAGEANGYMSRAWGAFLFPVIMVIVIALLLAIPYIDPKRNNIAKFRKYYDCLVMTIAVVFYYLYALTLFWNLGYSFDFIVFLVPAFAVLFFVIGMLLPRTEPNFMIGIRTPWTISSEVVWKKTHKAGGIAFKICGVIALLGIAFPGLAVWFLLGPIIIAAIGLVVYSYVLYEKEKRS